jgi:2-polyprenyl-3-methyl-5-hydroxy-6-metoxy-1,4-benzoquinol methylase
VKYTEAEAYWDKAGETSYASAMFAHSTVEKHVNRRLWQIGVEIGKQLGLNANSRILDLGCGDGALSNIVLSQHFHTIDGFDLSVPAIKRANELAANERIHFEACDITKMDFLNLPQYDGAYLWGILHHIKDATPSILKNLRKVTSRVVILEPNGNNLMRKLLERTKTYQAAGEDSFRTSEMEAIFKDAGFHPVIWRRVNLFPNFTPKLAFNLLKHLEPFVENTPILRAMCTVNMWGFEAYE